MPKHKKNEPRCFINTSVQIIGNNKKKVAAAKKAALWVEKEHSSYDTYADYCDYMAYEAECRYENPDRYYSSRRSSFNDGKPGYLGGGIYSDSIFASWLY
jgi:hypothetical protein